MHKKIIRNQNTNLRVFFKDKKYILIFFKSLKILRGLIKDQNALVHSYVVEFLCGGN